MTNKPIKQMTNREIEQMKMEMANELSPNLTNENKIERNAHDEDLDMFYPFV